MGRVPEFIRRFCLAVAALLGLVPACRADGYPTRTVTFVVSFSAGGVADNVARLVAQKLGERGLGSFVIENRGGAGGNLAARAVANAAADGYTVLATTTALAVNATASRNKGFAIEDLRAVVVSAIGPDVMAVHPSSKATTIKELLALAGPEGLSYGTSGYGTAPYIAAAYFFQEIAHIKAAHIPFTGGGPAVTAAIGNHVPVIIVGLTTAQPYFEQGLLRPLGIPAPRRSAAMPDIPTYAEAGYPNIYSATWAGFFVPARTPQPVVEWLNTNINAVVASPEAQRSLKTIGFEPLLMSLDETNRYMDKEIAEWGRLSKAIGYSSE